jgi:hypothetical protein
MVFSENEERKKKELDFWEKKDDKQRTRGKSNAYYSATEYKSTKYDN